jgi:hypothetical protein
MSSHICTDSPLETQSFTVFPAYDKDYKLSGFVFKGSENEDPLTFDQLVNYAIGEHMVKEGLWSIDS